MAETVSVDIVPTFAKSAISQFGKDLKDAAGAGLSTAFTGASIARKAVGKFGEAVVKPLWQIGKATLSHQDRIGMGLGTVGRSDLGGGLIGQVGKAAAGGIGQIKGIGDDIWGAVKAFKAFGDQVAGFVEHANPAVVERWNTAWDDMYAVIGHKLSPILDTMTGYVRALADALVDLLEPLDWVAKKIKFLMPNKNDQGLLETDNDYTMRKLAAEKYGVTPGEIRRRNVLSEFTGEQYARGLQEKGLAGAAASSSVGASYQPAKQTSFEEMGDQLRLAAFGSGTDPAARTAEGVEKTAEFLGNIQGKIDLLAQYMAGFTAQSGFAGNQGG